MNRELLLKEQNSLFEFLEKLSPEDKNYQDTLEMIDRIDRMLERDVTNKDIEDLYRRLIDLEEQIKKTQVWYKDPYFWFKVGERLLQSWLFYKAMTWEEEHVWTSKVYSFIKNLF